MPTEAQMAINDIAYVDLIDVCNLKCPTCVRGVGVLPNSAKKMPVSQFDEIAAKLKGEGYKRIGLFDRTEPFLVRNLHEYVAVVKKHDLGCMVSTNFSLRRVDDLEASLRAGIDHLIISVSGFDQAVYEINHVAGNIDYVKANTERTAALKRSGAISAQVVLRFLRFDYNADQEAKLEQYASGLGIEFEPIDGHLLGDIPSQMTDNFRSLISEFRSDRPHDPPGKVCPLMMSQQAIDHAGKAYLCCAYFAHPVLEIGNYLELSREELLFKKFTHPICVTCPMTRRDATPADKELLFEALQHRLGASPSVSSASTTEPGVPEMLQPVSEIRRRRHGLLPRWAFRAKGQGDQISNSSLHSGN
jgi:MoaA/NifB/PqqE/SkfB family radical SAM enzyme